MSGNAQDNLPTELLEAWLDGTLDDAGRRQVAVRLSQADQAAAMLDQLEIATVLRHALQPPDADQLARRVRALMAARRPERQRAALGSVRRRTGKARTVPTLWRRSAVVAAALLISLLGWSWWPGAELRVQVVSGSGTTDTQVRVQTGDRLSPGIRVTVDQPLTLRWPDASTLTFTTASRAKIEGDGAWLDAGRAEAVVRPRTTVDPFRVRSNTVTVTVVGTRFIVDTAPLITSVAVTSGVVRVTNQRGEERQLNAGGTTAADATGWVEDPIATVTPVTREPAEPNTLTAEERAAGWILLFDGTSTAGWRGYRSPKISSVWSVRDGTLQRVGEATSTIVDDLATSAEFGDFDLRFDWRISASGNSGVLYRTRTGNSQAHDTGAEYQVVDALRHPDGRTPLTWPGSCYAVYAPARDLAVPAGGWNRGRIVVRGAEVEHWLNDSLAVRYTLGSDDWLARVARSKFARLPKYGREERGRIILQDHGDAVAYQSLKLLPLQTPPRVP